MNLQTVVDRSRAFGHEIELVFFADGSWPKRLADSGFSVTVIEAGRLRDMHRWVATVARLARLLRHRQPDIIVNWIGKTQLYGSPAAVLAGMADRNVWWQREMPSGGWLDRLATACPAVAIGCSSGAVAKAQSRLPPKRPIFVVHPGTRVNCGTIPAPPLKLPKGVPIIGMVGRLQPWKGQDRLLSAHAILRDRGHHIHTLIIGGDAHELSLEYAASLPSLIDELQLNGLVTMTGQVDDARPYIRNMDILVNASDPEPFGIVLLEGMAAAVPVVAVDSGGPAEFLEDGRTGVLARSGEPNDLADALEPLVASPELRKRLGDAGHEQFLAEFTEAAMCHRFFDQLERLVQRHASTPRDGRAGTPSHPQTAALGQQQDPAGVDDSGAAPQ
jgi:glycosyltransferase involved in cell wall biosynthesis